MPNKRKFDLQIIITAGRRDIEKVTAGLAMALSSASAGAKVVVFLTMEAAAFANKLEGNIPYVHGFNSIQSYFDLLLELKVKIEVCTACVNNFCFTKKNKKTHRNQIRKGLVYMGLSTAAIRAINTPTLVF